MNAVISGTIESTDGDKATVRGATNQGDRVFTVSIEQIEFNYSIEQEKSYQSIEERKDARLAAATVVPANEVKYVLYGDEYLSVERFIEQLAEDTCDDEDESNIPEWAWVAETKPLTLSTKSEVEEYTYEWDESYTCPPDWEGTEEFQQAIDEFKKAIEQFEKANSDYFEYHCNHTKKVS